LSRLDGKPDAISDITDHPEFLPSGSQAKAQHHQVSSNAVGTGWFVNGSIVVVPALRAGFLGYDIGCHRARVWYVG
jgi:hypothetical protein